MERHGRVKRPIPTWYACSKPSTQLVFCASASQRTVIAVRGSGYIQTRRIFKRGRMKTKVMGMGVVGALLVAGLSTAGSSSGSPVTLFTDSGSGLPGAKGSLRSARFTSDSVQYIGCGHHAYDDGTTFVSCYARDAAGTLRTCFTSDQRMVRTAETLDPASYLFFTVGADGSCERLNTNTSSSEM